MRGSPRHILVIGAGFGGMATAIELLGRGYRVTVVERAAQVGGKARSLEVGGAQVDAGPTVLTMPWVFNALLEFVGTTLEERVALAPLDVLARHRWTDGSMLDLHADPESSAEAIAEFAGAGEAEAYRRFLRDAREIYDTVEGPFITGQRPTLWSIAREYGVSALPMALRVDGLRTMWRSLGKTFADPRLRQLFGRYATYAGNSPFRAPATFNLIAHVEAAGVWRPAGGMHAVASALGSVITELGGDIRLSSGVSEIRVERRRAVGATLESGEQLDADAVVFAGDVAALSDGRLGPGAREAVSPAKPEGRSLSAVTWCMNTEVEGWPLAHHNVIFGDDYAEEFEAIFERRALPKTPTVYICAQDVGEADRAFRDRQRLLVLVNAPANGDGRQLRAPEPLSEEEVIACEERTFRHLERCGLSVRRDPEMERRTDPRTWERMFPSSGGALYGQAAHHWTANLRRMGARSRLPGLYLCGGTVHPGAGAPMAALSGMLAAEQLVTDLPLTGRSLPAGTPGGIATSSATMASTI
jgi:1-hydroxycarotenoid 3,4-desaturase